LHSNAHKVCFFDGNQVSSVFQNFGRQQFELEGLVGLVRLHVFGSLRCDDAILEHYVGLDK
jgi:hypothetical protein